MHMDNIFIINHETKLFSNRRNLYDIETLLIEMVAVCWVYLKEISNVMMVSVIVENWLYIKVIIALRF